MVNPEWLRYFAALAETRNFAAAAEQLHITPQAMSNAIAGLETHYKLKLVDRGTRMKGLTPAGDALLKDARAILQRLELTDLHMAELRDDTPQGPLRLASVSVITNYVLPALLAGGPDSDQGCEAELEIEGKWPDSTHRRRIVAEVEQLETAISLCEAGLGVAFLPQVAVAGRLAQGSLAIVAEPPRAYTETYVAAWRKRLRQPPGLQALLDVLPQSD